MEGGIKLGGKTIKLLAFADDIVLLAPSAAVLQRMIICLEKYCALWNLVINLAKSKIMVFRNGGKPSKKEKWWLNNERIDVVNEYKYLGILLTTCIGLDKHFKEKTAAAVMAISNFNRIILNENVPFSAKLEIFNAVVRSSVSYGAQVWGAKMYNGIEILQKFFIKKVLGLPKYTPDFILYMETCLMPLFIHTVGLHLSYKNRCQKLEEHRYPHFFAQEIIKRKIYWYKDWEKLEEKFGVPIMEFVRVESDVQSIMDKIREGVVNMHKDKLQNSISHRLYKELYEKNDLVENYNYIYDKKLKKSEISWFFKVKGELMYLNKYSYKTLNKNCSMCNCEEEEDVWHFVARCPVLASIRLIYLGKKKLEGEEFIGLFEKRNLKKLAAFCKDAWNYRYELVAHFNY